MRPIPTVPELLQKELFANDQFRHIRRITSALDRLFYEPEVDGLFGHYSRWLCHQLFQFFAYLDNVLVPIRSQINEGAI